MKEKVVLLFLGGVAGGIIAYPGIAFEAARVGLLSFATAVLPALMPLLTLMLLLSSRVTLSLKTLIPMSLLCGSPGGARLLTGLPLSGRAARCAAALCGTMSPMFFLGTVSAWLGDVSSGAMLLIVHTLAALTCGAFFYPKAATPHLPPSPLSIGQAAQHATQAMLIALVPVVMGFVLSALIRHIGNLAPLPLAIVSSFLEVTGGAQQLCKMALQNETRLVLLSFFCAFGGLSIQMQNAAFLSECGVTLCQIFFMGIMRGFISALYCALLCLLI